MISLVRPLAGLALVLTIVSAAPTPAQAGYGTLKRSLENMLFAPGDFILAPVVAGKTEYEHLRDIDDTMGVRIAYAVPGYLWLTGVQLGASVIRGITGVLEFVPGVVLLPFPETEMDSLFDPVERAEALVDYENPVANVKFGIDYTSPPS